MTDETRPTLKAPLDPTSLRWRCDPAWLSFESTEQVEPVHGVIGQDAAIDALRFGLATGAPGHHIYVRGLTGTGRMRLVRRLMEEIKPMCPEASDHCYVRNFDRPERPRLLSLPRGRALPFESRMEDLSRFIREQLRSELESEAMQQRRRALDQQTKSRVEAETKPFEADLKNAGLAMVALSKEPVKQMAVFPLFEGEPVPPEEFERLAKEGKVEQAEFERVTASMKSFAERFEEVTTRILAIRREYEDHVKELYHKEVRRQLAPFVTSISRDFPQDQVKAFLEEVVEDVATRRLHLVEKGKDFTRLYAVNVVVSHGSGDDCPIVVETHPTLTNLLGSVEPEFVGGDTMRADHMSVRAGSLLQADGGYLLLDARDVLGEPGAWRVLVRTLRSGKLEIIPPDLNFPWVGHGLKPEPIDVNVKVVLIGDTQVYYLLDALDNDFPHLFKVLADFDDAISRSSQSANIFAQALSHIARKEKLPHFEKDAVVALVEHAARVVSRGAKLTARFTRVADIAREGAFLAQAQGSTRVNAEHIAEAIRRTKSRADLPSRRFRELITNGTIQVELDGSRVGQVNGLAVIRAGPLTYGFPQRITATVGPGAAGVINIEREAELSGAIHTKGFYILGGLLRRLLHAEHPLAFSASIAFEQSYGGIDGDSASGAEMCCLLSALTSIPLRQDLAMTGAIDQAGQVMAIGAVNEKIEGFFDACSEAGLTGDQGCIIPAANAPDLMLRPDVVEACAQGKFAVHAVSRLEQALELFTGVPAGDRSDPSSLLGRACAKAREYWETSKRAANTGAAQAAKQDAG